MTRESMQLEDLLPTLGSSSSTGGAMDSRMDSRIRGLRVVAVGLLIAAAIMLYTAQAFFQYWVSTVPFFSWALGIRALAPPVASTAGFDFVPAVIFLSLCFGIGLLLSAWIYAPIERRVVAWFQEMRGAW